MLNERELDSN